MYVLQHRMHKVSSRGSQVCAVVPHTANSGCTSARFPHAFCYHCIHSANGGCIKFFIVWTHRVSQVKKVRSNKKKVDALYSTQGDRQVSIDFKYTETQKHATSYDDTTATNDALHTTTLGATLT
jgi:hypothetical protein